MATRPKYDQPVVSVTLSPEEFAVLERVANEHHTSVHTYVNDCVHEIVRANVPRRKYTPEEVEAIVREAQAEIAAHIPPGVSLVQELFEERRREAQSE